MAAMMTTMVNESELQTSGRQLLPYALFALALGGLYASSRFSYFLFHSLIEVLGAAILLTIFVLAWNTRKILAMFRPCRPPGSRPSKPGPSACGWLTTASVCRRDWTGASPVP